MSTSLAHPIPDYQPPAWCTHTVTPLERQVYTLADMLRPGRGELLTAGQLEAITASLKDHQIELYNRPSERPGVTGHPGASLKQVTIRELVRRYRELGLRVIAASGANQCLAEGTLVATPRGPVAIEDLRPGDYVYDRYGEPTVVLRTFDQGERECVAWWSRKRSIFTCTPDHKVWCRDSKGREALRRVDASGCCQIHRIEVDCPLGPVHEPHAYAIGALLGDGCCREAGRLLYMSSPSSHVPDRVAAVLGGEACPTRGDNYTYSLGVRDCHHYEDWMRGRYSHQKTVDMRVIRSWNRPSLMAFIGGLLDTDGSVYRTRDGSLAIAFTLQSEPAIKAIQHACLALWQLPLTIHHDSRDKYKNGDVLKLLTAASEMSPRIIRDLDPYMVTPSRKRKPEYADLRSKRFNPEWVGGKLSPAGKIRTFDIQVEHHDNIFVLANGLLVRNCGKTESVGSSFCEHIRDKARDGDVFWVIAQSAETVRDIPQKTIWKFLPRDMIPAGVEYQERHGFGQISTLELTLPNGRGKCAIWFKAEEMSIAKFESARLNGIWWSECQREALFDALMPRTAKNAAFLLMDYVPTEAWHQLRIQAGANQKIKHVRFAMMDNAHNLPPGEVEHQRSMMTEEEAAVRVDGKDGAAHGVVIKEFRPRPFISGDGKSGHLLPASKLPKDWPAFIYIDVGKYTAALLLTLDPDSVAIVFDEVYTFGQPVTVNAEMIRSMLKRHGRTIEDVRECRIDPAAYQYTAANEVTTGDQYEQSGIPVGPWIRTQTVGETAMLDQVRRQFMGFELLVGDNCQNLINELRTWRHKTDKDGRPVPNEAYVGANHAIDSLKAFVGELPQLRAGIWLESEDGDFYEDDAMEAMFR